MATSPARQAEAERATTAFHLALTAIGVETVGDAITLWDKVPQANRVATAADWLDQAVALIMSRRTLGGALARAYYRLARALITGKTVADPFKPEPQYVTMATLRYEFAQLAGRHLPSSPTGDTRDTSQGSRIDAQPRDAASLKASLSDSHDDDNDRILVEEIERLKEQEAANAKAADDEARLALAALGPANEQRLISTVDDSAPASTVDAQRQDASDRAGARQAAAAARIAMNGARSEIWTLAEGDELCLGYVRISQTGTPCGWCAMLISRGPVYRSAKTASFNEDGDKYHDNCHCIAIPVWTRTQYGDSDLLALNREYEALWPQVTKGLQGKAALTAWRRYIRDRQKARTQAARATTSSVQEA